MRTIRVLLFVFFLSLVPVVQAESVTEKNQDYIFTQCLIKRGVTPPNIQKRDNEFCLRKAGIIDMGNKVRDITGNRWRSCLLTQSAEIDDGRTSPFDISRIIITLCENEWREYAGSMWMLPSSKRMFVNGVRKYAIDEGVHAVLLNRKRATK